MYGKDLREHADRRIAVRLELPFLRQLGRFGLGGLVRLTHLSAVRRAILLEGHSAIARNGR